MSLQPDLFHGVFQYITDMVMGNNEEDVGMFNEEEIQAKEQSFHEALVPKDPSHDRQIDDGTGPSEAHRIDTSRAAVETLYITDMLIRNNEEDVSMFNEEEFQAKEQSFHEALVPKDPSHDRQIDDGTGASKAHRINTSRAGVETLVEPNPTQNQGNLQSSLAMSVASSSVKVHYSSKVSKGKKHCHEEASTTEYLQETQSKKQLARYSEEASNLSEILDKVSSQLPEEETVSHAEGSRLQESIAGGSSGFKKVQDQRKHVVGLKKLLHQCAQAVSSGDNLAAKEILNRIRQQSSPHGDAIQRLGHYMANSMEARIYGTGSTLYADSCKMMGISLADTLKAYEAYFTVVPFQRMSNIFANKAIYRQLTGAHKVHIVDFGISYGFQWPCIIQGFSSVPGGSPNLRITGIDFPEPGFLPSNTVEKTGSHLMNYCRRFNVPFQYNCIANKWDSIQFEDLKVEEGERLVVNCMYSLRQVSDEIVDDSGPRDMVLNLIKKINPELLVLGFLNGNYNSAFFTTRFREALSHFSTLSDMFETTLGHEEKSRLVLEQAMLAKDVMNVIACEGTSRIERPERYKRWIPRIMKAGFMQIPLPKDIFEEIETKVRLQYHQKFFVRDENNWMVQGWNGRVLYGMSLWKSVN
ncbi:Scarecrow-like protein 14 [Heracleum sosnowskyi]|uniref:Scarecrow-like protein 14 n=1 Tax=Heracleum sosnowskyi TaxID=360622 RepID=A0AAD8HCT3_9APIA|nr:Scarecrow-like protein 14 [Heracleum sosnowskyi]